MAVNFWQSLTIEEQWQLADLAELDALSAGAILCLQGTPASQVIIIRSGWAKVCVEMTGRERILAIRGPGDLIGERAVLLVRSRSATVVALDTVSILRLEAAAFERFLNAYSRVPVVLERQIYGRLTEGQRRRPNDGTGSVERQLAMMIIELAEAQGIPERQATLSLPITNREVADWVDAPYSTTSEILGSWRENNVIINETPSNLITVTNFAELEMIRDRTHRGDQVAKANSTGPWNGQNCSIFYTDIASFSGGQRDDEDRRLVRRVMYDLVKEAFEESEVSWSQIYWEDRGDGVLAVVPPQVPTFRLVDPLLTRLAAKLRRHNRQASAAVRIQLRIALHVGPVVSDPEGVSGEAIIHTARLLDAPALKDRLVSSDADLGFIASQFVYDTVVKHSPGQVDPKDFQWVMVQVKEAKLRAWLSLFGAIRGAISPREFTANRRGDAAQSRTSFGGDVNVQGDLVMGNKIEYRN
ncbi:cyclic nucleotide-binding domain-containing protein [Actinomadura scrupuli]|uniref:cyclic nucleotide-binding domain-containing protein n=1 Tax=Actinomadura scrupuli TaxID=559629 RepID=UPI003D987956